LIHHPIQSFSNGLQARKLGLVLHATPELFKKGVLKLKCSATLLTIYQFDATVIIRTDSEAMEAASASSSSSTFSSFPVILFFSFYLQNIIRQIF